MSGEKDNKWLPLEANPEVMNKYAYKLGVSETLGFQDVYDLSGEGLGLVPRPVLAVLLLLPTSTSQTESAPLGEETAAPNLYFMKQTISNACGTIGIIHALFNNTDTIPLGDGFFSRLYARSKDLSPADRAAMLEQDQEISEAHEESAQEGQTKAPSRDVNVDLHFVAFVHQDGGLYELDGRKEAPVFHGNTTASTLLEDTAVVIQKFMARDPDNLNFTVVALAKAE